MPHFYDVKKDPSYKKGKVAKQREIIERALLKNLLSDFQIAELLDVSLDLVQEIKEALIKDGRLKEE